INYWQKKSDDLNKLINSSPDPTTLGPKTQEERRLINSIRLNIDPILGSIDEILSPRNFDNLRQDNFQQMIDYLLKERR
ncbi:MAG: hypothetical protein AAF696_18905, partial [Bacteroidota bacterium]